MSSKFAERLAEIISDHLVANNVEADDLNVLAKIIDTALAPVVQRFYKNTRYGYKCLMCEKLGSMDHPRHDTFCIIADLTPQEPTT